MSFDRPLRGGCHCGRNVYVVERPTDASESAQVLFETSPSHRISQATPLTAFIRVPLSWYRSTTFSYFPDETSAMIRRVYSHPTQQHAKRHFCGFCGTPLSYWSEEPRAEAEYIQLTLGSLSSEDLGDLEEMGLVPELEEKSPASTAAAAAAAPVAEGQAATKPAGVAVDDEVERLAGRETLGLPWFDSMMAGSRLENLRTSKGSQRSRDGRVRVEWEVYEWTDGDVDQPSPAKRKKHDTDDVDTPSKMEE